MKSKDNVIITGTGLGEVDVTHDGETESVTEVCDITVNSKRGDDTVTIVDLDIEGDLVVRTGSGQDTINFTGSESMIGGARSVNTGLASDKVTLDTITVGGITNVKLGDHKVSLTVSDSTFTGKFNADGGQSSDTFVDESGNTFPSGKHIGHFQKFL